MASKKKPTKVDPCQQVKTVFTGTLWEADVSNTAWVALEDLRADQPSDQPVYEYRLVAVHRVTPVREEIK